MQYDLQRLSKQLGQAYTLMLRYPTAATNIHVMHHRFAAIGRSYKELSHSSSNCAYAGRLTVSRSNRSSTVCRAS